MLLLGAVLVCLVVFAGLHVVFGAILYVQNMMARPTGYIVKKSVIRKNVNGGQTVASRLMPYTGFYILLFLFDHIFAFTFSGRASAGGLYHMVYSAFHNPFYVAFYVFSVAVVGLHVSHGFWSAFQTLGANHPRYMPLIVSASMLYAVIIGLALASIPLWVYLS
jgi:succinate dehydrogenase / fumarate reductase cytochrome b subunit